MRHFRNLVAPVGRTLGVLVDGGLADGPDLAVVRARHFREAGADVGRVAAQVVDGFAEGERHVGPAVRGEGAAGGGTALVGTVEDAWVEGGYFGEGRNGRLVNNIPK